MKGWSRYRRIRASRVRTRYRENSAFVIAEILKRFSEYDLMRPLRPAPKAKWPIGPRGRRPKAGIGYRHRLGLPVSADLRIDSVSLYIEGVFLSLHPVTRLSSIPSILPLEYEALLPSSFLIPEFIVSLRCTTASRFIVSILIAFVTCAGSILPLQLKSVGISLDIAILGVVSLSI